MPRALRAHGARPLCMDCHKEVGQDMRERTGYHGRQKAAAVPQLPHRPQGSQRAHRRARQAEVRPHRRPTSRCAANTAKVACEKCHETGKKYWDAPSDCNACHKKDDVHKGSLGTKCADCHTENDWKEKAKFDHDKTRFPLKDKHVERQVRRLPPEGCRIQGRAAHLHRLPQEGRRRPQGPQGPVRRALRFCHGAKGWKPSTVQPRHRHQVRAARQAPHRQVRRLPHRPPVQATSSPPPASTATRRTTTGPRATRAASGATAPPATSRRGWKEKGKFDHDKTDVPAAGQTQRREVRRLPQEHQLQGSAEGLHRLPQEGRQARGDAGHQVRVVPQRARLEDTCSASTTTRRTSSCATRMRRRRCSARTATPT